MIRDVADSDSADIAAIYNHYVANTTATFEEELVDDFQMSSRIDKIISSGMPWLVAEEDGRVCGFAYAKFWHDRSAYRHTVEVTIYVSPTAGLKGVGSRLYSQLFDRLQALNIHCAIAVVTLPNPPSVAIHEKFGMEKSGHFREVGLKFGQWLDVGYWTVHFDLNGQ
ncbi:N-acetyltransferase family protein [Thalassotalea maritima]|uniref:GNAT family N-acetyltransferase n=1 Tax=Thalassotalea maritima TaxID=3242416 RepID=UPI0035288946